MTSALWDERIARARTLAAEHPPAADLLTFYADLADCQKTLANHSLIRPTLDSAIAAIPGFLAWLKQNAPSMLARGADALGAMTSAEWRTLMESGDDSGDQMKVFVVEAVLQPYAEILARDGSSILPRAGGSTSATCLVCGSRPVVAALRQEGQGAKRSLLCGLCFTERDFLRGVCPSCGEQQFDALPIYTAEQFPHVRVDACERCRTYLKTVDLTKDGLAVPIVDDIASVSLDLWARDHGYVRFRPNLLGL